MWCFNHETAVNFTTVNKYQQNEASERAKNDYEAMRKTGYKNMQLVFATFLQNMLKSDVACFTAHVQTCLVTNKIVASCTNSNF